MSGIKRAALAVLILILPSIVSARNDEIRNLAEKLPLSAYSSSSIFEIYGPSLAFDGDDEEKSLWVSQKMQGPHYLSVRLRDRSQIHKFTLADGYNGKMPINDFDIQVKRNEGDDWETITQVRGKDPEKTEHEFLLEEPIMAEEVQLVIFDNGFVRVREFEVHGLSSHRLKNTQRDVNYNIAFNKPARSSSNASGYFANYAVDGVHDKKWSRWVSMKASLQNLTIDLLGAFDIDSAVLYSGSRVEGKNIVQKFRLQYFDGKDWKDIPGGYYKENRNPELHIQFSKKVKAYKIRFIGEDEASYKIRDLEIYGSESADLL